MHFIHSLRVNFDNDALGRFQKSVMDNSNGRPPECHHNIMLMQFRFWKGFGCFVMMKPMRRSFTIVIKNAFFITSRSNTIKKWIIRISGMQHRTHFKTYNSLISTECMWNPFNEFLPLANFLQML